MFVGENIVTVNVCDGFMSACMYVYVHAYVCVHMHIYNVHIL